MRLKTLVVGLCTIVLLAGHGAKGDDTKSEKEDKTIRIGASATLHAGILKHVKLALEKKGYKVGIEEFTDYAKPNQALIDDELDANFLQHKPCLIGWAKETNVSDKLTSVFTVHLELLGIYPNNHTSLKEAADGQKISVPNDPTNGGRALKLLADSGIIILKEGKDVDATRQGTEAHNKKVEIVEMQVGTCATSLPNADFAVANENNALNAKISNEILVMGSKDSEAAQIYVNTIAVQTAYKDDEKIKDLTAALSIENVEKSIEEKYNGIVVPLVSVNRQKKGDIDTGFTGILYLFFLSTY